LFEFSRFYENIGVEKLSKMNVAECFNQAIAFSTNLDTIRIVNDCPGLEVMADLLLRQLFYNFLDNTKNMDKKPPP
jgi:hypothetical protein